MDYKGSNVETLTHAKRVMLDRANKPFTALNDGPFRTSLDKMDGVFRKEVVSYRVSNGFLYKETAVRHFTDGDQIWIEPFRAKAFKVIRDLVVDRSSFDRIIQAGGYVSVNTGQAVDGNTIPIEKERSSESMDAAACIGCGACVAACPNGSAMLFTAAKAAHLGILPQGEVEEDRRVLSMVSQMDKEGFGKCSNTYACEAECPKEISVTNIARLNRVYLKSSSKSNL